jgi:hypothetical protein
MVMTRHFQHVAVAQPTHFEVPVLGLSGRWRFYEKDVGSACRDVRFQFFRSATNDTLQSLEIPEVEGQRKRLNPIQI